MRTLGRLTLALAVTAAVSACSSEAPEAGSAMPALTTAAPSTSLPAPDPSAELGEQAAEQAALAAAGTGSSVVSVEQGDLEGRPVWQVTVSVGGVDRVINVDRVSGEVLTG